MGIYKLFGKARLWYDKGNALVKEGDFKGAIECYSKAIEIEPSFAMAWMNKGNALNELGDFEEGLYYMV